MSTALYPWSAVRFWSQEEIERRDAMQARFASTIYRTLRAINPAWQMFRCEGPILTPRNLISAAYDASDIYVTNDRRADQDICLRAETTASSYAVARKMQADGMKLPLCLWQAGKSFRTENNDGASPAKMRYNEFWQQEFQCIYRADSKADYFWPVFDALKADIKRATGKIVLSCPSDRLPAYSQRTEDIEVVLDDSTPREVASCSIRTDYHPDFLVAEFAIGLCRLTELG